MTTSRSPAGKARRNSTETCTYPPISRIRSSHITTRRRSTDRRHGERRTAHHADARRARGTSAICPASRVAKRAHSSGSLARAAADRRRARSGCRNDSAPERILTRLEHGAKLGSGDEPSWAALDEGIVAQPGSPSRRSQHSRRNQCRPSSGTTTSRRVKITGFPPRSGKSSFGALGVTNIRTFVDPQNPNHVAVVMDVPDLDAFATAMKSDAAAEAMAHDGVMPETLVILVEE